MKKIYKSFDELPIMLSVTETATVLGISRTSAYELVKGNNFPSIKVGSHIVVPKDELQKWIQKQLGGKK